MVAAAVPHAVVCLMTAPRDPLPGPADWGPGRLALPDSRPCQCRRDNFAASPQNCPDLWIPRGLDGDFLDTHRPPVILDEIQYAPRLLRDIKARVDRRREPGQYLLTGSQTFPLMQSVSQSLAGRAAVVPLPELAAAAFLRRRPASGSACC